jgi:UDP-glucose 4-epimerase
LIQADDDVLGHTFNAGSGTETSIGELVALIASVMGRAVRITPDARRVRPADSEVQRLVCDSTALQAITSWKPQHTLEEGLRITAKWFSDPRNLAAYKTDRYVV